MEIPNNILNRAEIFSSSALSFRMTEKAMSLSPDTLIHLMLPKVLDVIVTRSWDALIHVAEAVPVGRARIPVTISETVTG